MSDNGEPDKQGETGRGRNGRYLPGTCGNPNGRPKALDLRAIAETKAKTAGVNLEDALWEVVEGLLTEAKAGDEQAARVVSRAAGGRHSRGHRPFLAAPFRRRLPSGASSAGIRARDTLHHRGIPPGGAQSPDTG